MKLLALVSKDIGLNFLKSILNVEDNIFVIIGNENREEIVNFVNKNNLSYVHLEDFTFLKYKPAEFDWLLNLWSPLILKEGHLSLARFTLNIHPSLLPNSRGRDPIVHGLLNNERLGFTFHSITLEIDQGPIIFQKEISYNFPFDARKIYNQIISESTSYFKELWPKIRVGGFNPIQQEASDRKANTREITESLRVRGWNQLTIDQREVLNWIASFDFKNDYGPILEINNERFKVSINYSRMDNNDSK
jgi:methionyl-tRNA formyltransferase